MINNQSPDNVCAVAEIAKPNIGKKIRAYGCKPSVCAFLYKIYFLKKIKYFFGIILCNSISFGRIIMSLLNFSLKITKTNDIARRAGQ